MRLVLLLCRGKVFWDFFLRILHLKSGHHRWELCLSLSMHFIKRQMLQAALLMSICRPRRASLSPGSDTLELCKDICASWISVTPCYPWNNAAAVGTFSTLDEIWSDASLFFGLQPLLRRAFPFLSADMFWLFLSPPQCIPSYTDWHLLHFTNSGCFKVTFAAHPPEPHQPTRLFQRIITIIN